MGRHHSAPNSQRTHADRSPVPGLRTACSSVRSYAPSSARRSGEPAAWVDVAPPTSADKNFSTWCCTSSAADPTEFYAPGKSHEISRCTPCPASVSKEDDTKCYARGSRLPHASTERPHGPGPIAHTGTRRRRIIRYYAATTRCTTAWKLWLSVASLEHRTGAEHLRRA